MLYQDDLYTQDPKHNSKCTHLKPELAKDANLHLLNQIVQLKTKTIKKRCPVAPGSLGFKKVKALDY